MTEFKRIENTQYLKSLTPADKEGLRQAFEKWPQNEQEEFIEMVFAREGEGTVKRINGVLEKAMSELHKSERGARKDEENTEKEADIEEAEAALSQL